MTLDTTLESNKAVIYARVSSTKKTTHGDGLGSQETRCREYARYKGYEVVETFSDDMSGSLITRPGMQAMLGFLRKRRKIGTVVIIDDISRLARGMDAHLKLRTALSEAGGKLESPSSSLVRILIPFWLNIFLPVSHNTNVRKTASRPSTACAPAPSMAIGYSRLRLAISTNASQAMETCWCVSSRLQQS